MPTGSNEEGGETESPPTPRYICGYTVLEAFTIFNAFRSKIVVEDQNIHYRTSWMIACEAMLAIVWASVALPNRGSQCAMKLELGIALMLISAGGAMVAFLCRRSVQAARRQVLEIEREYGVGYPDFQRCGDALPQLLSTGLNFKEGRSLGTALPWAFVALNSGAAAYVFALWVAPHLKLVGVSVQAC